MTDLPVIYSLKAKRAELDGELMETEKRAIRLRQELETIDRTLKIFDPEINLAAIRPVVRRASQRFFKHGHFTRAAIDVVRRGERPLTCREIAERLNAEYKLNAGGVHEMRALVKMVHNAFKASRDGVRRDHVGGVLRLSIA